MNFNSNLITLLLAASSAFELASAQCTADDGLCLAGGKDCTHDEDACCGIMECTGFNFYKTCQDVPECLPEWHDCSIRIPCCDDMECVLTSEGASECQVPAIGKRTTTIAFGQLVDDVEEDKDEPEPEPNLVKSTKLSDNIIGACVSGDPHVKTFDNLVYDCQGIGEFILMQSKRTARMAQGRFKQVGDRAVSVMRGVVVQDEGIPDHKVQIHVAETDFIYEEFGDANCRLQIHIDGVQHSLFEDITADGYTFEDDVLRVSTSSSAVTLLYKQSEMEVVITVRGGDRCALGACFYMPETDDELVGMLGSPDKNADNDWMKRDGSLVADIKARRGPAPYSYCTDNWCMTDVAESKFKYNEEGFEFDTFQKCDFPEGSMLPEEIMEALTVEQAERCQGNIMCMEETVGVGDEGAKHTMQDMEARDTKVTEKSRVGEACEKNGNCKSGNCFKNGWAGERCVAKDFLIADLTKMTEEGGHCNDGLPCDTGMECVFRKDTNKYGRCHKADACGKRGSKCAADDECCGACMDDKLDANGQMIKRCKKINRTADNQICYAKGEDCHMDKGPACCGTKKCVKVEKNVHKCQAMPTCWAEKGRNCNSAEGMPGCCGDKGLICMQKSKKGNYKKSGSMKSYKFACTSKPICVAGAGECGLPMTAAGEEGGTLECCNSKRACGQNTKGKWVCMKKPKTLTTDTEGGTGLLDEGTGAAINEFGWDSNEFSSSGSYSNSGDTAVDTAVDTTVDTTVDTVVDTVVEGETAVVEEGGTAGVEEVATRILSKKYYPMYNAGNPEKQLVAGAYCTMDCETSEFCVHVRANEGIFLADDNAWFKNYDIQQSVTDLVGGGIDVAMAKDTRGHTYGWDGCFDMTGHTTAASAEIHANWGTGTTCSSTASTGKTHTGTIAMEYCGSA